MYWAHPSHKSGRHKAKRIQSGDKSRGAETRMPAWNFMEWNMIVPQVWDVDMPQIGQSTMVANQGIDIMVFTKEENGLELVPLVQLRKSHPRCGERKSHQLVG